MNTALKFWEEGRSEGLTFNTIKLKSNCPTLLVQNIVNFSIVKEEQRSRGRNR